MLRTSVLLLALALGPPATARAEDDLLLVQDSPALRDLALTVHGRQALSADPAFRALTITVQVKKGIAELRGQVPTAALATQAAKLVEEVQGILGVRNYLEIRAVRSEPGRLILEPEPPSSARAASPNPLLFPDIPLTIPTGPAEPTTKPEPARPPSAPPRHAPPQVTFLSPVFMDEPIKRPAPIPEVLVTRTRPTPPVAPARSALLALLSEPAFKEVKIEQRGRAVFVHTKEGQGATTMALARRLRDVPGIEEIVLVPEGR